MNQKKLAICLLPLFITCMNTVNASCVPSTILLSPNKDKQVVQCDWEVEGRDNAVNILAIQSNDPRLTHMDCEFVPANGSKDTLTTVVKNNNKYVLFSNKNNPKTDIPSGSNKISLILNEGYSNVVTKLFGVSASYVGGNKIACTFYN